MTDGATEEEIRGWLGAVGDPRVGARIVEIYDDAERSAQEARPLCLAGGHCCRFAEYGHDLFVTGLETAWFVRTAGSAAPHRRDEPDARASRRSLPQWSAGACPWLDGRLCGARIARPLGCRTFYCDPRRTAWSTSLHERLHGAIRSMHDELGIVYRYGEWLRMLGRFADHLHSGNGTP